MMSTIQEAATAVTGGGGDATANNKDHRRPSAGQTTVTTRLDGSKTSADSAAVINEVPLVTATSSKPVKTSVGQQLTIGQNGGGRLPTSADLAGLLQSFKKKR
jgi:hypothetical protein